MPRTTLDVDHRPRPKRPEEQGQAASNRRLESTWRLAAATSPSVAWGRGVIGCAPATRSNWASKLPHEAARQLVEHLSSPGIGIRSSIAEQQLLLQAPTYGVFEHMAREAVTKW